ncbi:MAG: helix-turn-helix domain-containing protein [Streptococcus sp.]
MSLSSPFGPTFRKIREARGLSLKEVAADIVSPQFLSQFERSQKGVTIETFSRLLLSMGVDWDTFLSHYPGLTIQNFSPILMKHINQENMDFLAIIERLKHEKSPVARREQRALATLFALRLKSMSITRWEKEIHLEDAPVSIQRIAQEVPFAYQNEIEQDFTIALLSVLPYEVVAKIRKESLELLKAVILPTLPMHWPLYC